ncbi:MAG: DUF1318 domain-containing protein [Pseudomonadota bacterium]
MISRRCFAYAVVFAALAFAGFAAANPLDDARAQGWLGERPDGYIGLVDPSAPASAKALMDDVNAKRRALYAQRAAAAGVRISDYQAIAAGEIFDSLPRGVFVMDASGAWSRK